MAGRSGKLTNEALAARGPRMVLACGRHADDSESYVIFREDQSCFHHGGGADFLWRLGSLEQQRYVSFQTVAKSFTLTYLLKIGKTMMEVH
jgi:hypothetical protein